MTREEIQEEIILRLDPTRRGRKGSNFLDLIPAVECEDGFTVSVQASGFHYCLPRHSQGPWTHVEMGFPSEAVEALMPYAEDDDRPTETVYANVPIEIVAEVIEQHGGFKS